MVHYLHDHSLAVAGSRVGIDAPFLHELSIKSLKSQDHDGDGDGVHSEVRGDFLQMKE